MPDKSTRKAENLRFRAPDMSFTQLISEIRGGASARRIGPGVPPGPGGPQSGYPPQHTVLTNELDSLALALQCRTVVVSLKHLTAQYIAMGGEHRTRG